MGVYSDASPASLLAVGNNPEFGYKVRSPLVSKLAKVGVRQTRGRLPLPALFSPLCLLLSANLNTRLLCEHKRHEDPGYTEHDPTGAPGLEGAPMCIKTRGSEHVAQNELLTDTPTEPGPPLVASGLSP